MSSRPRADLGTHASLGLVLAAAGLLLALSGMLTLWLAAEFSLFGLSLLVLGLVAAGLAWWSERHSAGPLDDDFPETEHQGPGNGWLTTVLQRKPGTDLPPDVAEDAPPPTSAVAKERVQYVLTADQKLTADGAYPTNHAATVAPQVSDRSAAPQWSPEVWQHIEWRRLLTVVTGLFIQVGFQPSSFKAVGLTGADVVLSSGKGPLLLRCIATRAGISRADMRAFVRVVKAQQLVHATLATGGQVSPEARALAREHGIHTLDGEQLLKLIATRTPAQQHTLHLTAYAGAYWRPSCMHCGIKLVPRLRPQDHRPYWGCRNAPDCTVALPMDMAQLSRLKRPAAAGQGSSAAVATADARPVQVNVGAAATQPAAL
ncbi:hypothetical protein CCO03_11325 [Comamonas serinivorans]|uniref:Restriction endonuclease type IV Mrr domain-containing protein n=1 Tax=Comamonas serinivorans TaxID=1082851 RepID=A0A1Y0ENH0_9BURK|nr:restriction endonuclease [Comamonas serinivorans]ARU05194.1 hypothetical protein CCO03_11325 [Comamonas serinivorans]